MKRTLGVIAAALAVMVMGTPAHASGNEVIEIKNVAYDQCLQPGEYRSVDLVGCTGAAEQKWERVPLANGHSVLRNLASRDCVYGYEYVGIDDCDGDAEWQFIDLVPAANDTVKIKYGARFAQSGGTSSDVHLAYESADERQLWQVKVLDKTAPPLPDTTGKVVRLKNLLTEACISVASPQRSMERCGEAAEQTFQRVELGDGRFKLRSTTNNQCLGMTSEEFPEERWGECVPTDPTQEWRLETDQLGAHMIRSALGGDVSLLVPTSQDRLMLFMKWLPDDNWFKWKITLA